MAKSKPRYTRVGQLKTAADFRNPLAGVARQISITGEIKMKLEL